MSIRSRQPVPKAGQAGRGFGAKVGVGLALAVTLGALAIFWSFWPPPPVHQVAPGQPPGTTNSLLLAPESSVFAGYAGSASCRECHPEAFEAWTNSNHELAERAVRADLDQAGFDPGRRFAHGTQQSEAQWHGGNPEVTSLGLTGGMEGHRVERVIGNDPLRQFLVAAPGGRLQTLEASFDPRSNAWFNVYGQEDRQPGEWGHWTGRGMNWNSMCAACHNTRLRKNYDESTDSYHTTMAERSVGCEACHGPLRPHVDWQRHSSQPGQKDPTVAKLTLAQTLDNCGFCHARRTDLTGDFRPGDAFLDHQDLVLVDRTDRYYPDGQVRDEDYEYGSFLGSRMHFRGVTCLDCHNPHSGKTLLPGNWLCQRCHNGSYANAPVIEPVSHSHHQVFGYDSHGAITNLDLMGYQPRRIKETGGECANCHMPQTVYMQRHWRHDHGFTIPDPLLTQELGVPNACNRCHADKDNAWSRSWVDQWYGTKMDRPTRRRAQWIARVRREDPAARDAFVKLLPTEEIPYWRAVEVGLLERWVDTPEVKQLLLRALSDTNGLVRAAAVRALEPAATEEVAGRALQLRLVDRLRNVRVAAAWALRSTSPADAPAALELRNCLDLAADQPTGQMQKGVYHYSRNELERAIGHLQKAITWEPSGAPIREELAVVLSAANRTAEAVEQLTVACRLAPAEAESRYKLGLAYSELSDLPRAAEELETAVQLNPAHGRAWYNLGLAQNALQRMPRAIECLFRAESLEPGDARIPYARATILARSGSLEEARAALQRALEIRPGYPEARQLLDQLTR